MFNRGTIIQRDVKSDICVSLVRETKTDLRSMSITILVSISATIGLTTIGLSSRSLVIAAQTSTHSQQGFSLKSVVWIYDTFKNYLGIKQ